jgi:aerobic-type carbon monoxide dehydrogenase small subunit (CoxS/CutS family)
MIFTLNGVEKSFDGDPELSLLKYLREYEEIISPKDGCAPQAACGACTVELNGKSVLCSMRILYPGNSNASESTDR